MAEVSICKTRSPLAEATNRINATYTPMDTQGQKSRQDQHPASASTHTRAPTCNSTPAGAQPDIRVTATQMSSNPPVSAVLRQPEESDEAKRLSQVSYESNSSSRSKYKTHVGPWQLGRTLGKGSSARVRLCRHNVTNQLAAVKIVNRRMAYLVQDSSMAALSKWDSSLPEKGDGEMRVPMAIEREVAILKLIEHPHIMKLYDIWENRSEIYLILEYIDQGDLFTFINSRGRLTEEVSIYFFRQMISAITYCHSFNICHRDLKPENILITADYQIKIADFGMAALHQTDTHQLATACGSPHYAAPELLKNRQYRGDKADIWSMGVILYAMLAATLPFDDPDLRVMMNKTKKGQYEMPKHISPEAEDLIRRMLQVNPERRISLKDIWRHPLVQKYSYLDNYGENSGQPPDMRKGFQYNPVPRSELDPQLLRQLRSMWHMFSEHDLALKLTCEEPNDQKAFYWLLYNYREKQLEDFKPELAHSMSDYHHLKPAVWKKRVSTCEFTQPRANGHGRSVSRFTVISNAAETEAGTIQSYDPYRGSRIFQHGGSEVSHAKITVHRDRPSSSGNHASHASRMRSGSNARRVRANSTRASVSGRPASSRGSMTSLHSSRQGTPHARGPSLRHKRGVDFAHVRRRSSSVKPSQQEGSRSGSGLDHSIHTGRQRHSTRSQSPELPIRADGIYPMAKGAPGPTIKMKDPVAIFAEELRHFSSNIAKDCDTAFNSSLIEEESVAGSLTDLDRRQRDSPFAFSLDSAPGTPATEVSVKPWDSRPLPPLPSDKTLNSHAAGSTNLDKYASSVDYGEVVEKSAQPVARAALPVLLANYGDRRVVSAPAQTHHSKKPAALPSINENKAVDVVTIDKARIVSAPPQASPKKVGAQARGVEFLSMVENSIRVVHSPTEGSPVKIPRPLNVRKKTTTENLARNVSRKLVYSAEYDDQSNSTNDLQGGMRKKKSWFRRSSKTELESGAVTARQSQDQLTLVESNAGTDCDVNSTGTAIKKKTFSFPFWKSNKSADLKMMIADDDTPEGQDMLKATSNRRSASNRDSSSSSNRNIDVKQNWLARLFRVKPATSYICMTISRKRARQEVAILLREWRKYGIRGIQVDKQRNIVFARVRAENFLELKEVAFAAEIMTVIEHGKKQPMSIIRFTQERGAASSFHKVVDTMRGVFDSRHLLVTDRSKQKMMVKTLNS